MISSSSLLSVFQKKLSEKPFNEDLAGSEFICVSVKKNFPYISLFIMISNRWSAKSIFESICLIKPVIYTFARLIILYSIIPSTTIEFPSFFKRKSPE